MSKQLITNKNKINKRRNRVNKLNVKSRINTVEKQDLRKLMYYEQYFGVRNNNRSPFPNWTDFGYKYVDVISIVVPPGGVVTQRFRTNSLFDPDRTGVGHQPLGRDIEAQIYNRYVVDKFEYHTIIPTSSDTVICVSGIINGDSIPATVADFTTLAEMSNTRVQAVGFAGGPSAVFDGHRYLSQYPGVDEQTYYSNDRFSATMGTDPTENITYVTSFYNPGTVSVALRPTYCLKYKGIAYDLLVETQNYKKEADKRNDRDFRKSKIDTTCLNVTIVPQNK